MIGRNFIVKNAKKISKHNVEISPGNFLPLARNPEKSKWFHSVMMSLTKFTQKSKSVFLR